jgi:hypothetical protein
MPGMPGNIAKVPISKRGDEISRDPLRRAKLLEELEDWNKDYVDILVRHGVIKKEEGGRKSKEEEHFRYEWFSETRPDGADVGYWMDHPNRKHFIHIHRRGMIEALRAAQALNKPIDTYWICTGHTFEIFVCGSEQQITRIILTPSTQPRMKRVAQLEEELERLRQIPEEKMSQPQEIPEDRLTQKQPIRVVKRYVETAEVGEEVVERDPYGRFMVVCPKTLQYDALPYAI